MTSLQLDHVSKQYPSMQEKTIFGLSLEVQAGEFVVFVGPSGCGKSTLLRMIAGLEDVTEGEIILDGKKITGLHPAKRDMAMVFQSYALYPHMNVRENMGFALRLAKIPQAEQKDRVDRAAKLLEITNLLDKKPRALSGGQRQRVAIGRAIVREPKLFLFDEPLSNLDATLRTQTRLELSLLHQRLKTTMIYVTHDQVEAMTLANRIVVLNGGRIEQMGTPDEVFSNPQSIFVAGFIGVPKMSFLSVEVADVSSKQLTLQFKSGKKLALRLPLRAPHVSPVKGATLTLGLRPEDVILVHKKGKQEDHLTNPLDVTLSLEENLGNDTYYHTRLGEEALTVRREHAPVKPAASKAKKVTTASHIAPGTSLQVCFRRDKLHLFDSTGKTIFQSAKS